ELHSRLPCSSSSSRMMFYALALLPLVMACGPGTGKITDRPTLKFKFSPPLGWTYPADVMVGPAQSLNEPAARNRINSDIQLAVIQAVESYGYSTSGVRVDNAVAPVKITINPAANACVAGNGVPVGGAVTLTCNGKTTAAPVDENTDPLIIPSSITVTSPIALAESNWDNIANKVYASLSANAGVKFDGIITVEA
ncbi:hypothetical protein PFISCL1PPCAC_8457, partial [Pristionchus fissidentatus]